MNTFGISIKWRQLHRTFWYMGVWAGTVTDIGSAPLATNELIQIKIWGE
jgi:hypothetical protein